ncbi:nucleoside triphosphate pyrophosphohydrolase [Chryseomicrobium sp. FSL W7-1435]|uniref:nucleoside triphosphate pyrophosphohydrolase n=1 Tax=Chryseomicrobium sp. FSL W7-1435 TaxID=2921704 RepID=UPI00315A0D50
MPTLTIIGLGVAELDQLPLGLYKFIKQANSLYIRTEDHPVVKELAEEGLTYTSFDAVYEKHDDFSAVYREIADTLIALAKQQDVIYAVPGHPLVAEQTVQHLIEAERAGQISLQIKGGQSFLDPLFAAVRVDPIEGFQLLDGTAMRRDDIQMNQHLFIGQVYDAFSASEVKLTLMEKYPDDFAVTIVTAAGSSKEVIQTVPLFELDRVMELSNLTTVYVPPAKERDQRYKEWQTFRDIVAVLRSPEGCPWDREQTHESLKRYAVEEVYELLQAINEQDDEAIVEELGDVLLQVFLHAQIGEDEGYFSMEDVLEQISAKMVRRHPHVFGDVTVDSTGEVLTNWQAIKETEKPKVTHLLEGQKRQDSSLLTSFNFQKKAATVGFDWPNVAGAWDKFDEELQEWKQAIEHGTTEQQLDELGDVLFTLVNLARFLKLSPELAMQQANQKFERRFRHVETSVRSGRGEFSDYTLDELEEFWQQAKQLERGE